MYNILQMLPSFSLNYGSLNDPIKFTLNLMPYKVDMTKHTPDVLLITNTQETKSKNKERRCNSSLQISYQSYKRTLEATVHYYKPKTITHAAHLHKLSVTHKLYMMKHVSASMYFCKIDTIAQETVPVLEISRNSLFSSIQTLWTQ